MRSLTLIRIQPVDMNAAPKFEPRKDRVEGTTDTWRAWAEAHEVEEWIQSVGGCLLQGWNDQVAQQQGVRHYEFPTGFNTYFTGQERFAVGEQFFAHSQQLIVRLFYPLCETVCSSLNYGWLHIGVEPEPPEKSTRVDHVFHRPLRPRPPPGPARQRRPYRRC